MKSAFSLLTINPESKRIEIRFPEKPDKELRDAIKAIGFKWDKSAECWFFDGLKRPATVPCPTDVNSLMTVDQFAKWRKVSADWVLENLGTLPGIITDNIDSVVVHPLTYLEARLK